MKSSVDGTNSNTALIALGYVGKIADHLLADYASDFLSRTHRRAVAAAGLGHRSSSAPGTMKIPTADGSSCRASSARLTLTLIVNLTAFAIVREREVGTLEQIMVTPIRPIEFILGKTLPFFLIGLARSPWSMAVGTVMVSGSVHRQSAGAAARHVAVSVQHAWRSGLLISTICTTQQQAFATNFFVVNPMFTLSGFSFPIASMPLALQWFSYINPLRYYPGHHPGLLPERRWALVPMARPSCARSHCHCIADGQHFAVPQIARLNPV